MMQVHGWIPSYPIIDPLPRRRRRRRHFLYVLLSTSPCTLTLKGFRN